MNRIKQPKISKHVFGTKEEAQIAFDLLQHTFDEDGEIITPCYHKPMGLKAETIKSVSEDIETEQTGRWQLDVLWFFDEDEEFKVSKELEASKIDLTHEGNHGLAGYSYLKNKI